MLTRVAMLQDDVVLAADKCCYVKGRCDVGYKHMLANVIMLQNGVVLVANTHVVMLHNDVVFAANTFCHIK